MIKKLPKDVSPPVEAFELVDTINELIDVVNRLDIVVKDLCKVPRIRWDSEGNVEVEHRKDA